MKRSVWEWGKKKEKNSWLKRVKGLCVRGGVGWFKVHAIRISITEKNNNPKTHRSWNSHTHVCAPCCISTRLARNTGIYLHIEIEKHVHWELQLCFRQIQHNVYDHTRFSMYSHPHLTSAQPHHKATLLSCSKIPMPMCWEYYDPSPPLCPWSTPLCRNKEGRKPFSNLHKLKS